jgi:hypothetical protein
MGTGCYPAKLVVVPSQVVPPKPRIQEGGWYEVLLLQGWYSPFSKQAIARLHHLFVGYLIKERHSKE